MAFSVFGYSKSQLLIYVMLALGNFSCALCMALQAPFFPSEAEKKGANATQYGFVFGVFQLVCFLVSPIFGKYMDILGPNFMCTAGLFFSGSTCILFGLLDKVNGTSTFVGLAIATRITEALGNAAFKTSSFSIIAKEYPEKIGSVFSTLQSFYGMGLICGPTLGGLLYSVGGYSLPFTSLGSILLGTTILSYLFLPLDKRGDSSVMQGTITTALKIRSIPLMVFAVCATTYTIGCAQVGLEPHLRQFNLTPVQVGFMFIISGLMYGATSPIWGNLVGKYIAPRKVIIIGGISEMISFTLLGPAPYINIKDPLWLNIVALIFQGTGIGASYVGCFTGCQKEAVLHGMPDDISTYGVISGLYNSSLAFGAFMGPTLSGYIIDIVGFRAATQVVVGLHAIVVVSLAAYECCSGRTKGKNENVLLVNEKVIYGSTDPRNDNQNTDF